jgi:hypothetical protein
MDRDEGSADADWRALNEALSSYPVEVTVEGLKDNPWLAVVRDLPAGADAELSSAAALAADAMIDRATRWANGARDPAEKEGWLELIPLAEERIERAAGLRARMLEVAEDILDDRYHGLTGDSSEAAPGDDRERAATGDSGKILPGQVESLQMDARDSGSRSPFAANQNEENVTLKGIEQDPWNAVDRRLPEDADRTLLERTAFAAGECAKAAFAAARVAEIIEPDLAPAYWKRGAEASERDETARHELGHLPPEEMSKVSPFLDPKKVIEKALSTVMIEVVDERGPARVAVTNAAMDANPWSIIRSDLSDADPELLLRVQATALGLVRDASDRRDRSLTTEEASLWAAFADLARNTYAEAECELIVEPIEREGEKDRTALIDMIGEAAYRAVNEPVPQDADAQTLLRLSDSLDVALDRLDAINQGATAGISLDYIAWQYGKAAARQNEVETRLEAMDWEIDRDRAEIEVSAGNEVSNSEFAHERYSGLTRDEGDGGKDRGRSR